MAEPAGGVTVDELVKRYSRSAVKAVDGVSFAVGRGEAFGLLGPNGAGKTTTVGVLTTRVRPSGGRATVSGVDVVRHPVAAKRRLAVVPQLTNLDRSLSARQNLLFHAAYFGVPREQRMRRASELLEQFGLADRGDDKVDFYSGGQTQRIMIARALMHEPEVLFLDEPTTRLDPQARLFVWDRVREMKERGITVILTTHDMDEAATLCDRVGIMDRGRLLALDSPAALTSTVPGRHSLDVGIGLDGGAREGLVSALGAMGGVQRVERVAAPTGSADDGRRFSVRLYASVEVPTLVAPVARLVTDHGGEVIDLGIGVPSLEDVFIQLTGRGLR